MVTFYLHCSTLYVALNLGNLKTQSSCWIYEITMTTDDQYSKYGKLCLITALITRVGVNLAPRDFKANVATLDTIKINLKTTTIRQNIFLQSSNK